MRAQVSFLPSRHVLYLMSCISFIKLLFISELTQKALSQTFQLSQIRHLKEVSSQGGH